MVIIVFYQAAGVWPIRVAGGVWQEFLASRRRNQSPKRKRGSALGLSLACASGFNWYVNNSG
jgi:hypothetical protein